VIGHTVDSGLVGEPVSCRKSLFFNLGRR
jgi:hypothetical protein